MFDKIKLHRNFNLKKELREKLWFDLVDSYCFLCIAWSFYLKIYRIHLLSAQRQKGASPLIILMVWGKWELNEAYVRHVHAKILFDWWARVKAHFRKKFRAKMPYNHSNSLNQRSCHLCLFFLQLFLLWSMTCSPSRTEIERCLGLMLLR